VTRVLSAVSARKHSDNHKVSNAIGGHIKCLLLVCDTCGREVIQSQGQGHTHQTFCDGHFDCDKCNKLFADIQRLNEHNAKEHGMFYQCDICKELEAREATGIGYICCVCDAEFENATELEEHMSMHDNVLPH
jgi:hypothetical protein